MAVLEERDSFLLLGRGEDLHSISSSAAPRTKQPIEADLLEKAAVNRAGKLLFHLTHPLALSISISHVVCGEDEGQAPVSFPFRLLPE